MNSIGVSELIYQGEIYDLMNTFTSDLSFYEKWCRKTSGEVLELCCGTGRLTIPLKQSGIPIAGLDITPTMLSVARVKAARAGLSIEFIQDDIRTFRLSRKFGVIFIPFNSLQHTFSLAEIEALLANVKRHLAPGGVFLFDVYNPSIHLMVDRERTPLEALRFHLKDGREVVVREQCDYDAASQVNRVKWFFRIGNAEEQLEHLHMRCFYPLELDLILRCNGWIIQEKFGSFDEKPFVSESSKQICVCRPAGE